MDTYLAENLAYMRLREMRLPLYRQKSPLIHKRRVLVDWTCLGGEKFNLGTIQKLRQNLCFQGNRTLPKVKELFNTGSLDQGICNSFWHTVRVPLTTAVTIQKLLFETPDAAYLQEWLQCKDYFCWC